MTRMRDSKRTLQRMDANMNLSHDAFHALPQKQEAILPMGNSQRERVAVLWVKPSVEFYGDSVAGAASLVDSCTLSDSVMPAPHAGEWFAIYFTDLIKNARPPLLACMFKIQQLEECKAALAAVQDEIKEVKEKVVKRENQLERALEEGKLVSSHEKLLDSASTYLTGLQNKEKELLKRESQLLRTRSTSDDEIQEISPTSEASPKRRKIDDLIEKSKKYLFRTDRWGCVTVIKKRKAVTFAHNEHHILQPGMRMTIYSVEEKVEHDVTVVKTNAESDWVLLESAVDLCEEEPIWGPVVDGHRYVQLGLSARHQKESPFAISTGIVCSERPNVFGHTLGSSGANPGDSGGGCFHESYGYLIGINVGFYDKISSRYATRAHIIPINSFQFV